MRQISPTLKDLADARIAFEANETRDLFYRAATELVDLSLNGVTSLTVAESLAVLLQTWNSAYYRFRKFDKDHFTALEDLVTDHDSFINKYRPRSIEEFVSVDEQNVRATFDLFERTLGPVGASKVLHLLAPRYFPLWDRAIAEAYGLSLGKAGTNAPRYISFLKTTRTQAIKLLKEGAERSGILKSIDEFNYCKFTKGWL